MSSQVLTTYSRLSDGLTARAAGLWPTENDESAGVPFAYAPDEDSGDVEQRPRILVGDQQERASGTRRDASALFPVL